MIPAVPRTSLNSSLSFLPSKTSAAVLNAASITPPVAPNIAPAPDAVYEVSEMEDNLALNVINFILKGTPLFEMITADFNIKAMAALDAGMRSCESGKSEEVKNYE